MQSFDKILDYIKHESESECKEIALNATRECERIKSDFSKKEQDAYWNCVSQGAKEVEERVSQLSELAAQQARKMVEATEQDMLDEVLELTTRKLSSLPTRNYKELLKKLNIEEGCRPEYLVHQYRNELAPTVISALFD